MADGLSIMRHALEAAPQPQFSVIFPLVDDRGAGVEATQRWLAQDAPPESFELVVVTPSKTSKLARAVHALLRPHDQLVELPQRNESQLYNFGARHARGPLWLFTESHVLPELNVVSSVCRHFAEQPLDAAATVASGHASRNRVAEVDEALFRIEEPVVKSIGAWRSVSLRALAVRAQTFAEFGPFDEDCRRFAETVFGLRLTDAERRIGWIDAARMDHVNIQTLANMAEDLRYGAQGQTAYRARTSSAHLDLLGPMQEYAESPWCDSQIAGDALRAAWSVLARDAVHKGCGRRNQRLWKRLAGFAAIAGGGPQTACWSAKLRAYWQNMRFTSQLLRRRRLDENALSSLIPEFLKVRLAWVKVGVIEELQARRSLPRLPRLAESTELEVAVLRDESCLGCGPAEPWLGRSVRWTDGFALLRLPVDAVDQTIKIGFGGELHRERRRIHLFWNGKRLDEARLIWKADSVEFQAALDECREREQTLVIASDLVRLDETAPHDRRRLGLPLATIEVRSATRRNSTAIRLEALPECESIRP
ncbi:MAG: hypothetical protein U0939_06585 [Pirellulales bacterium]